MVYVGVASAVKLKWQSSSRGMVEYGVAGRVESVVCRVHVFFTMVSGHLIIKPDPAVYEKTSRKLHAMKEKSASPVQTSQF